MPTVDAVKVLSEVFSRNHSYERTSRLTESLTWRCVRAAPAAAAADAATVASLSPIDVP